MKHFPEAGSQWNCMYACPVMGSIPVVNCPAQPPKTSAASTPRHNPEIIAIDGKTDGFFMVTAPKVL